MSSSQISSTTATAIDENFVIIIKPEQSGKTFVMIAKINEYLAEEETLGTTTVNFIFCDNSLLLTKQTKERIQKDVCCLPDIEEPYVELSSRKDGSAKNHSSEVRDSIEDGTRNVVCCTNGKRMVDIMDIIRRLNKHNEENYKFKIWLDEADKFDNYIETIFIKLVQLHNNVEVFMLTATPQPIFKKYKELRTMALENTTLPMYHGWNDCDIQIRENESGTSTIGFARQIADEMLANGELIPGAKGYVPSDRKKKSHDGMRDMFVNKGVAVFVVNGEGVELTLPQPSPPPSPQPPRIRIPKTKELHQHIIELYTDYDVSRWPCVITGNICVGRGISIQQPNFMFNFGILSNCAKKTEVSQNAGRLKGNFKHWEGYAPPRVYTTEMFDKIAKEYETQSREIARIAFEKLGGQEGTAIVTNTEVKNVICSETSQESYEEPEPVIKIFTDFYKAKTYVKEELGNKRGPNNPSKNINSDGFYKNNIRGKTSVMDTKEVYNNRRWGIKTAGTFRLHSCYEDINDQSSLQFWVIHY